MLVFFSARRLKPDAWPQFRRAWEPDDVASVRGDEEAELKRQEAMAAFTRDVPMEGNYEVIEEIKP